MSHNSGNSYTHPEGLKRLTEIVSDFQLTMQHALRQDLKSDLEKRAVQEAGVLPPLSAAEMFDYLMDTDSEFMNHCFPFCAFKLDPKVSVPPMHFQILHHFRKSLDPVVSESASRETTDAVKEGGDRP